MDRNPLFGLVGVHIDAGALGDRGRDRRNGHLWTAFSDSFSLKFL